MWRDRFVIAMQASGYPDFTLSRANLMGAIDRINGTKLVDLAARLGMTKQAAGQIVDDLEAAGYVTRIADPEDGRAKRTIYTDQGLTFLVTADLVKGEIEAELAGAMSKQDVKVLGKLLLQARTFMGSKLRG